MSNSISNKYKGERFTVVHCEGAIESFEEALQRVTPHNKQRSITRAMIQLIERLANGERLSKDSFPSEGNLPKSSGKFYAFKKLPIRAYCWQSKKHGGTYFISHYKYKDKSKLLQKDIEKVHANWRNIEESL